MEETVSDLQTCKDHDAFYSMGAIKFVMGDAPPRAAVIDYAPSVKAKLLRNVEIVTPEVGGDSDELRVAAGKQRSFVIYPGRWRL